MVDFVKFVFWLAAGLVLMAATTVVAGAATFTAFDAVLAAAKVTVLDLPHWPVVAALATTAALASGVMFVSVVTAVDYAARQLREWRQFDHSAPVTETAALWRTVRARDAEILKLRKQLDAARKSQTERLVNCTWCGHQQVAAPGAPCATGCGSAV